MRMDTGCTLCWTVVPPLVLRDNKPHTTTRLGCFLSRRIATNSSNPCNRQQPEQEAMWEVPTVAQWMEQILQACRSRMVRLGGSREEQREKDRERERERMCVCVHDRFGTAASVASHTPRTESTQISRHFCSAEPKDGWADRR